MWSSGCRRPSYPTWGGTPSTCPPGTTLFAGIEDERFYFVHSYGVRDWTLVTNDRTRAPLVTWAEHGGDRFVAAVENGPLSATQFHPEKSGDAGARLLRNWVRVAEAAREQGTRPPARGARAGGRRSSRPPAPREAEKRERRDARKRALTSRLPRRHSRQTGVLAAAPTQADRRHDRRWCSR